MSSPQPTNGVKSCGRCGKTGIELKHCAKCKFVLYCNRECQTNDWKQHKKKCRLLAAAKDGTTPKSSSCPSSKRRDPNKPFTAINDGVFLHDRPEKEVYKILTDVLRMRQEDTYSLEGDQMTGTIYNLESSSIKAFKVMLRKAKRVSGLLPPWWNDEKERECVQFGEQGPARLLECAQEKSDIQERWNDNRMPMKLRMLGEKIYGNTPGVRGSAAGANMLALQMAAEGGSPAGGGVSSEFDLAELLSRMRT